MRVLLIALVAITLPVLPGTTQNQAYVFDNNPATGSGNAFPFGFPSPSNYNIPTVRFMQVLEAKYLPTTPVKITEVAFSRAPGTFPSPGNSPLQAPQFQLRMSHSTLTNWADTTFANWQAPCPTELISTTFGFSYLAAVDTWTPIGTVADFGYDGKRNICLELRFRNATSGAFACHSGDGRTYPGIPRIVADTPNVDNYVATTGRSWNYGGLKVCLTYTSSLVLLAPDTINIGSAGIVQLTGLPSGDAYQVAASLGQTMLNLPPGPIFLTPDSLFTASVLLGPPVFVNYAGVIPASGTVVATLNVLNIPQLAGLCVYHAGVAYNARQGILGCTNTAGSLLIP